MGCDSATESGNTAAETSVQLTGQLVRGSITEGVRAGVRAGVEQGVRAGQEEGVRAASKATGADPEREPLSDHVLYCVTFEDEPRAGKGSSDRDGQFKITLAAVGVPFGCFILNSAGERVADLIFKVGSAETLSGTTTLSASTDVGTVIVDLSALVAVADLTGSGSVRTPMAAGTEETDPNLDPTGGWTVLECQRWVGTDLEPCPAAVLALLGEESYFDRVDVVDAATGERRYYVGLWLGEQTFQACGGSEGLTPAVQEALNVKLSSGESFSAEPFPFVPEPPSQGSWEDHTGTCRDLSVTEPIADLRIPCRDLDEPVRQATCYAECFLSLRFQPPAACVQERIYDTSYLERFKAGQLGSEFNLVAGAGKPGFIAYLGEPLGRKAFSEIIYPTPTSASGAAVLVIPGQYWDETDGRVRSCVEIVTVSASVSGDPSGESMEEDSIFNAGISQDSPDFDWCVDHGDKLQFAGLHGASHLRVKLKKQ